MDERMNRFFGGSFHKWVFLVCLIVSVGLIITSFFIPPLAAIDGSVLAGVGELFGFAALGEVAAAIERGHTARIQHGNTSIEISKDDNNEVIRPEEQYQDEEDYHEQY